MAKRKKCWKCGQYRLLHKFGADRTRGDGLSARCKSCLAKAHQKRMSDPKKRKAKADYDKAWLKSKGPEYSSALQRRADLGRKYGMKPSQYNEIFETQKGVCAICFCPETSVSNKTKQVRNLCIDHCHDTGKIRGLLCNNCNNGIGKLKDSITLLNNAVSYLEKWK